MYQVNVEMDSNYQIYVLKDTDTDSWVKVAPERGGIILSYGVAGDEFLYLNEETFINPDANVRGGIPILFPISGQLSNGTYVWEGETYSMKNHGFARNLPWEVVEIDTTNRAALTIRLASNEQTRVSYPFDFEVIFTYSLENGKLTIDQEYKNKGDRSMPISAGFHPYFKTSGKHLSYTTDATRYYDYNDGVEKEFTGSVDLTNLKESVLLLNSSQPNISFQPPGQKKPITLRYGSSFKYVVLWTEKDKEFICVEPWMAKNDEFNRGEELVIIQGGDSLKTVFSMESGGRMPL
ncbi:aldose epimerase [Neobacillus sp. OS1-2]|uniref:aldose epimerase family protein n=1 Tax=Neobacillus sp. OS1-2 TaxID=3070680 RepID=UPI0027E20F5B|nr:aldose epimerase [Neobacillus sp. OS1-2]WML41451.1 aldose epimerase [Neobacillus sp. OS1-2]